MHVESLPCNIRRAVRAARGRSQRVGVVPTMGALHEGHVSLIKAARRDCDFVVATIFVNPMQFGPNEDFSRYPRTLDSDLQMCRAAGADLVFTPGVDDLYGPHAQTVVSVKDVTRVLEGAHRPGHFDGVSTIVSKLFNITEPDCAYFGQKDYQQQLVIRQMVADLDFAIKIVTCPIIREADGLAMSSRNRYLSAEERLKAAEIYQTLKLAESLASDSPLPPTEIADQMYQRLASIDGFEVGYATLCSRTTLLPLSDRSEPAVALIAVRIGATRLIDNMEINFSVA